MMRNRQQFWLMVPARGGSKGIPRKNLRHLAGKPLITYVLETMQQVFDHSHLIVSTDDDEIAYVCAPYATIHQRPTHLANDTATLDEVAVGVVEWLLSEQGASPDDILFTIQPTSPFMRPETIVRAQELLAAGARSIISVRDDRRLRWTQDTDGNYQPLYAARVNRQQMPPTFSETGGLFAARLQDVIETKTRINPPIALIEMDEKEGLDIDTYSDWMVAEYFANRLRILIRADAGPGLGMGHVYRALALATQLSQHDLVIVTRSDGQYSLGRDFLQKHPYHVTGLNDSDDFWDVLTGFQPELIISDVLDSSTEYMQRLKETQAYIVSLEDLGPGAQQADIVINDLYSDSYPQQNHWYGVENSILSPHFETIQDVVAVRNEVRTILVSFGGTDPGNHTRRVLNALQSLAYTGRVMVVLGPGYAHPLFTLEEYGLNGEIMRTVTNMAMVARQCDLAITSAGRTVTELMTLGLPTMVLCQNLRELRHTHASSAFGIINLGLGEYVEPGSIAQHIQMLLDTPELRRDMQQRALRAIGDRSNARIVQRILDAYRRQRTNV